MYPSIKSNYTLCTARMANVAGIFLGLSLPHQMGKQWSCLKAKPWGSLLIWPPAECHLYQNGSKGKASLSSAMLNQQRRCCANFVIITLLYNCF